MTTDILERAGAALERVRTQRPLTMCLTNTVVTNWSANCLLALGATPAMMEEPEEASELAAVSGAVLINVGTVTRRQAETMRAAIASCNQHNVPWVLDPVAADKLTYRKELVREFLALGPKLIRGNAGEIDDLGAVDCVTLSTGAIDSAGRYKLANGVEFLSRVTGTGCAQGALAAAFCAVEPDAEVAAVATSLAMALAGEKAYAKAKTHGAFQMAILDALGELTAKDFVEMGRLV